MKNIFFDFGRTIVEHPADRAGLNIILGTGVGNETDAKMIQDVIFSVSKYGNLLDEGSLIREDYKRMMLEDLPKRLHPYALEAADYNISLLPVIKGMEELLDKLKRDGFKLYITSNMSSFHALQMRNHRLAKYFDDMIFSAEIKTRKPYREFFESAFKKFHVKAEDCLFIDDLEENIEGGKKCGIKGFVFNNNPHEAEKFIYENK